MDFEIQHHTRTRALGSRGHVRSGPFVVRFDPNWAHTHANYAIPDDGAAPTAGDVDALIDVFHARDRVPRLEFLPSCAPLVEPALTAAGFTVENRAAVLTCDGRSLVRPEAVSGLRVVEAVDEAGLVTAATVQHTGYGQVGEPGPGEVDWLRATVEGGGVVALAIAGDGTPAGAGLCSPPLDGLSELAGLAVAADHRRRGIGAVVSAFLTARALDRGSRTVWLEPGDPHIQRIYERIGYRRVGEKLNISLPRTASSGTGGTADPRG